MKKVFFVVASFLILGSCLKEPDYSSFRVDLIVDFGDEFRQQQKAGAKVVLFNQEKAYKVEAVTDQNGKVHFSMVEPGFYSVTVSYSYVHQESTYYLNGLKAIHVFDALNDTIKVYRGRLSPFVLKEIYYSGCNTPAGKTYYADQYLEIFNNSPEIQYADGISVLIHEASNTGENQWGNIKDSIVAELLWTIPGNGMQVPVEPGRSIIIAQDGMNHRDDPNGNPLSPVNLGNADFEFYSYKPKNPDIDSPAVPNMIEDYSGIEGIKEVAYDIRGGSAIAIAKIPGKNHEERKTYIKSHLIAKSNVSGSSVNFYPKVANKYILDAVEVVQDEARAIYKRFPQELDAGYTYVASGSRSGKCIRRKAHGVIHGRTIYQDTNNSTEDFLKDVDPRPKIYE